VERCRSKSETGSTRHRPLASMHLFQRCPRRDGELPRPGAAKLCCSVMRDGNVLDRFKLGLFGKDHSLPCSIEIASQTKAGLFA
jgi:hypothetical protein